MSNTLNYPVEVGTGVNVEVRDTRRAMNSAEGVEWLI